MGAGSRRAFLKLCLTSAPALALGSHAGASQNPNSPAVQGPFRTPQLIDPFIDPLPIPRKIQPHGRRGEVALYRVRMLEIHKQLHSQLPPTKLWGFEGEYPGPTFDVMRGKPVEVEWVNSLPTRHIFSVDPHIHGAMPPSPAVRTVTHLHGSRTTSESDGLPEKWFTPGHRVFYHYPNEQRAAPLWYHDHALGITRLNVYAGLSGFYFLRDEQELSLNLPSGDYEIPLILQDRTLDDQGQLVYGPSFDDGTVPPPGVWAPEFFGKLPVVNGAIYPYLEVEPRPYRLRLLNSCNSRFLNLYFNLARNPYDIPSIITFQQIGSDGGLLAAPASLERLLMAPAERADLIVDFSKLSGKTVTLSNNARAPYPGWSSLREIYAPLDVLAQFRVTRPLSTSGKAFSMPSSPIIRYDPAQAVTTRDFILTEKMDPQGRSLGVVINNKGYDDPVTETPKLGTLEKWRFLNTTEDAHPMHLHLVQFQILERQGFDYGSLLRGDISLVGNVRPAAPNESGWKDTAIVSPMEALTLLVRFEGFTGRYVYHCHMLEHEDNDMMRPYEVVAADPTRQT